MFDDQWLYRNRLPCGVLIMAVAMGAAALFADAEMRWDSAVLPWSAKAEGLTLAEPCTALGPHADELARRFGVRDRLAAA